MKDAKDFVSIKLNDHLNTCEIEAKTSGDFVLENVNLKEENIEGKLSAQMKKNIVKHWTEEIIKTDSIERRKLDSILFPEKD